MTRDLKRSGFPFSPRGAGCVVAQRQVRCTAVQTLRMGLRWAVKQQESVEFASGEISINSAAILSAIALK